MALKGADMLSYLEKNALSNLPLHVFSFLLDASLPLASKLSLILSINQISPLYITYLPRAPYTFLRLIL